MTSDTTGPRQNRPNLNRQAQIMKTYAEGDPNDLKKEKRMTTYNVLRIKFGCVLICNHFVTIHYVLTYKTIYMYYLIKSHDSIYD